MPMLKDILTVAGMLVLMILVFVGAYYASRLVGGGLGKISGASVGNIKLLERTALGHDKYPLVVRAADKVLLLGVTGQHIDKLDELDGALFPDAPQTPPPDFLSVLKAAWKDREQNKEGGGTP